MIREEVRQARVVELFGQGWKTLHLTQVKHPLIFPLILPFTIPREAPWRPYWCQVKWEVQQYDGSTRAACTTRLVLLGQLDTRFETRDLLQNSIGRGRRQQQQQPNRAHIARRGKHSVDWIAQSERQNLGQLNNGCAGLSGRVSQAAATVNQSASCASREAFGRQGHTERAAEWPCSWKMWTQ